MRGALILSILLATAQLISPRPAMAQEYWGKFADVLEGTFIDAKPRPLFRLSRDFAFLDPNGLNWPVPRRTKVDGASIPPAFWSVIGGPFEGPYLKASVIHDYYCDAKTRTAHDTHRNFYYGMRAAGVPEWKAKLMHWAVATFGPRWKLVPRLVTTLSCQRVGGRRVCSSTPVIQQRIEAVAAPNLDDPEVLALALGKLAATAKTLKTSDGKVVDSTSVGFVDGSLDSIEANASNYRALLASDDLPDRVDELGVMADPNSGDNITAWQDNKIPSEAKLDSYKAFVVAGEPSLPFTIEKGDIDAIGKSLKLDQLKTELDLKMPS